PTATTSNGGSCRSARSIPSSPCCCSCLARAASPSMAGSTAIHSNTSRRHLKRLPARPSSPSTATCASFAPRRARLCMRASTRNNVAGQTNASFVVDGDNTEDIRVSSGSVDTTTRGGEHTTLQSGEYVAFNQQGSVKSREHLLDMPAPTQPRDLERIPVGANG